MIWIIGGGPKSHQICQYLNGLKKAYKLTTVTDYKRDMPLSYTSKALSKPPSEVEIRAFIEKENVKYIIDHSYGSGTIFSKELMKVCEETDIIYIRYEEKTLIDEVNLLYEGAKVIRDIEEIKESLMGYEKPIFLDVNRKVQKEVSNLELKHCIYKGKEDVISVEDLKEIFEEKQIQCVLVGENESLPIYIEICKVLRLPLMIIKRNKLQYKRTCYNIEKLKEYLQYV